MQTPYLCIPLPSKGRGDEVEFTSVSTWRREVIQYNIEVDVSQSLFPSKVLGGVVGYSLL
jgi:hypothetical protein